MVDFHLAHALGQDTMLAGIAECQAIDASLYP